MKNFKILLFVSIAALMLLSGVTFSREPWGGIASPSITVPPISSIAVRGTRAGDTMTDVRIEPFKTIYVDRTARIWWENYSDTPISVQIGKGNKCKAIHNGASLQLFNPATMCGVTKQPIPPNGSMIIRFEEASTYNFEIQFLGTTTIEKGQLIVF
jgi:hypothetical protein